MNDFWKPDRKTQDAITKGNRAVHTKPKRKQRPKEGKSKPYPRKPLLRHFGLNKFATNFAICFRIHKETGYKLPDTDAEARKIIAMYWAYIRGNPKNRYNFMRDKDFYSSKKWKELRYVALQQSGGGCELCGARASDGVSLHVDHIKPRSHYPELQLSLGNLQILCEDCNYGKSNIDDTDWRY